MCSRCGGSGYIPKWSHIAGGVCFKCNGRGSTQPLSIEQIRHRNRIKEQQRKERLQNTLNSFSDLPF